MSLDRRLKRIAEGGAHADVCDAAPPLSFDQSRGHVDALARNYSIVRLHVSRRKTEIDTARITTHHWSFDPIGPAQHAPREIDSSIRQQLANHGGADSLATQSHFRYFIGNEAKLRTYPSQQINVDRKSTRLNSSHIPL